MSIDTTMTRRLRARGLHGFPQPLPDEHLWSIVARYHQLSANRTAAATRAQLGIHTGPLKAQDLFNRSFSSMLPVVAKILAVEGAALVRQHSPLPVFELSMSQEAQDAWHAAWAQGGIPAAHDARPMNWRILRHDSSWQYCRNCLSEDRARHGVAYWHATHQVPGLAVCPTHGTRLVGCCEQCGRARTTLDDLALPASVCDCTAEPSAWASTSWDAWLSEFLRRYPAQSAGSLEKTLARIRGGFGLPYRITGKHDFQLDAALEAVERAMGPEQLAQFFEFYGTANGRYRGRAKPNLVKSALTDSWRMMRHPLYFLVLLRTLDAYASQALPA